MRLRSSRRLSRHVLLALFFFVQWTIVVRNG